MTNDPHWIHGQATLNGGDAPTCSKCGSAVAPNETSDHEFGCWGLREFIVRDPDGNEVARYKDYWATGAFEQHTNGDEPEIKRLIGLGYYCRRADWPQEK